MHFVNKSLHNHGKTNIYCPCVYVCACVCICVCLCLDAGPESRGEAGQQGGRGTSSRDVFMQNHICGYGGERGKISSNTNLSAVSAKLLSVLPHSWEQQTSPVFNFTVLMQNWVQMSEINTVPTARRSLNKEPFFKCQRTVTFYLSNLCISWIFKGRKKQ